MVLVSLFGLVQLPQFALQPSQPLLAAVVSLGMTGVLLVVMPFFQGGLLGMADEALGGLTGMGTLVAEGKANYLNLLLAYLAVFAVNAALGFVVFFAEILGVASQYTGDGGFNMVILGIAAVVGLLFVLAYFLVAFFIQFYAHAIVLSDTGLVAGFKHSVGLVRRNLVSVLGYTLVLLAGSLVLGGIGGVASMLLSTQPTGVPLPLPDLSLPLLIGAAIIYVVTLAILGAFYATYSVAFYRSIDRGRDAIHSSRS